MSEVYSALAAVFLFIEPILGFACYGTIRAGNPSASGFCIAFFVFLVLTSICLLLRKKANIESCDSFRKYCFDKLMHDDAYYEHCKSCYDCKCAPAFGSRDDYYTVPSDLIKEAITQRGDDMIGYFV